MHDARHETSYSSPARRCPSRDLRVLELRLLSALRRYARLVMIQPDQLRTLPERPPEVGELVQVRSPPLAR